ncbi:MAG: cell division protein ZapE [Parvularcula sp.]
MTTPLSAYLHLVKTGTLTHDTAQEEAAVALAALAARLQKRAAAHKGWFRRTTEPPKGLYLWGGVGVGKSLLMDLFIQYTPAIKKRRVHFHAFMQEVHAFIADWRAMDDSIRKKHPARAKGASLDDPIPHAAEMVFQSAHLLCFDEFQVTDIADAMLLGRLFAELFDHGAIVVATSNRHTDDLYKDGINRALFLPFIDLIKDKMTVRHLTGAKDYRQDRLTSEPVYFFPVTSTSDTALAESWEKMTAGAPAAPEDLHIHGRTLRIPIVARECARGSFDFWCGSALGPADYLAVANRYSTIFIEHIPTLTPENRNEAARFVTLVDALYEAHCTLVCSADAAPEALYPAGSGAFEFERTASRLAEMQSQDYLQKPHISRLDLT